MTVRPPTPDAYCAWMENVLLAIHRLVMNLLIAGVFASLGTIERKLIACRTEWDLKFRDYSQSTNRTRKSMEKIR